MAAPNFVWAAPNGEGLTDGVLDSSSGVRAVEMVRAAGILE